MAIGDDLSNRLRQGPGGGLRRTRAKLEVARSGDRPIRCRTSTLGIALGLPLAVAVARSWAVACLCALTRQVAPRRSHEAEEDATVRRAVEVGKPYFEAVLDGIDPEEIAYGTAPVVVPHGILPAMAPGIMGQLVQKNGGNSE